MAENGAMRALELAISWARDWNPELNPYSLENALLCLIEEEVPMDKYPELWEELRRALRENPYLQEDEEMRRYLTDPEEAARGYWWFDPESW